MLCALGPRIDSPMELPGWLAPLLLPPLVEIWSRMSTRLAVTLRR